MIDPVDQTLDLRSSIKRSRVVKLPIYSHSESMKLTELQIGLILFGHGREAEENAANLIRSCVYVDGDSATRYWPSANILIMKHVRKSNFFKAGDRPIQLCSGTA